MPSPAPPTMCVINVSHLAGGRHFVQHTQRWGDGSVDTPFMFFLSFATSPPTHLFKNGVFCRESSLPLALKLL